MYLCRKEICDCGLAVGGRGVVLQNEDIKFCVAFIQDRVRIRTTRRCAVRRLVELEVDKVN